MALVNTANFGIRCLLEQEKRMTLLLFRSQRPNHKYFHHGRVMMVPDDKTSQHQVVEGLMGRQEHEFSVSRSREISTQITELAEKNNSHRYSSQSNSHKETSKNPAKDSHVEVYDSSGSVSLHGCMQSNVPHPFDSSNKGPSHMNMPQGGVLRLDKYVYHNVQKTHPKKNFSTFVSLASLRNSDDLDGPSIQGIQGDYGLTDSSSPNTIQQPQGIQGMDCPHFQVWLENCVHMGRRDCLEEVENISTGKKTLAQLFAEQDEIIKNVPKNYSKSVGKQKRSYSTAADSDKSVEVKLTQRQRLKKAVKEYGATVVVFHIGIALTSLGGFYLLVSGGLDVMSLLEKIGVSESNIVAGASTFVMAYAIHKVFAPVRIAITLTATPLIVRHLRKIGFLKTPVTVKK